MTGADFLSEVCEGLFRDYPLAVTSDKPGGYRPLYGPHGPGRSWLRLLRAVAWLQGRAVLLFAPAMAHGRSREYRDRRFGRVPCDPEGGDSRRADAAARVPAGVGARHRCRALVAFYATYSPMSPDPYWSVMPLADIPPSSWPPFAGEPFFGCWFWEYYRAGNVSSLDDLIAATPGTVFWINTKAVLVRTAALWHAISQALKATRFGAGAMSAMRRCERASQCRRCGNCWPLRTGPTSRPGSTGPRARTPAPELP